MIVKICLAKLESFERGILNRVFTQAESKIASLPLWVLLITTFIPLTAVLWKKRVFKHLMIIKSRWSSTSQKRHTNISFITLEITYMQMFFKEPPHEEIYFSSTLQVQRGSLYRWRDL